MALWLAVQALGLKVDLARHALLELQQRPSLALAVELSDLLGGTTRTLERAICRSVDLEDAIDPRTGRGGCALGRLQGCTAETCNCPGGAR
jgi:hypothetical protein